MYELQANHRFHAWLPSHSCLCLQAELHWQVYSGYSSFGPSHKCRKLFHNSQMAHSHRSTRSMPSVATTAPDRGMFSYTIHLVLSCVCSALTRRDSIICLQRLGLIPLLHLHKALVLCEVQIHQLIAISIPVLKLCRSTVNMKSQRDSRGFCADILTTGQL